MTNFVHLHNHSCYSRKDALSKPRDLAIKAQSLGQSAIALTDHGTLGGLMRFHAGCRDAGVKPILGIETYLAMQGIDVHDRKANPHYHLVLLAKNKQGFSDLLRLNSFANMKGKYYVPRVDFDLLSQYSENLIALSACIGGPVGKMIEGDRMEDIPDAIGILRDIFKDRFYLELQFHENAKHAELQKQVNNYLETLATDMSLPLVITNDCHYVEKEHVETHKLYQAIKEEKPLDEHEYFYDDNFYVKSSEEMSIMFPNNREAIENTAKIADQIESYDIDTGTFYFPNYISDSGKTVSENEAKLLAAEQAYSKLIDSPQGKIPRTPENPDYWARIDDELNDIKKFNFANYFLINKDIMEFCENNKIPRGISRGSGGGSLVAYLLGISQIDPIQYNLYWERFFNRGRVAEGEDGKLIYHSLPDFDLDVSQAKRDDVLEFIKRKYDSNREYAVSNMGTNVYYSAKTALKAVGKSLRIPFKIMNELTSQKMSPESMQENMQKPDVRSFMEKNDLMHLLPHTYLIEDCPSHVSVHASGIIISPTSVMERVPLVDIGGTICTEWEMEECEKRGLVKFDILGLRTLDVRDQTLSLIGNQSMDLDDPEIYRAKNGLTEIFQLESAVANKYYRAIKPKSIPEISTVVAIIRPQSLDSGEADAYIRGGHVHQETPILNELLKETRGVLIYQEQAMEIAKKIAGFTLEEADDLRKAIGKKKPELMVEVKKNFIKGSINQGYTEEKANEIFDIIEKGVSYGFNKCRPLSAKILTSKGWRTISQIFEELKEGSIEVFSYDTETGKKIPTKLVTIHHNGKQTIWKCRLNNEEIIEATPEHKFLCTDKEYHTLNEIVYDDLIMINCLHKDETLTVKNMLAAYDAETYSLEVAHEFHNYVGDFGCVEKNSHSVGYATLSAQCLWLKNYYPVEYYCSVLNSYLGKADEIKKTLSNLNKLKIKVVLPDINASLPEYSVRDGKIMIGLSGIKGLGVAAIEEILAKRPFANFQDLLDRCEKRKINKLKKEALLKSGALDSLIDREDAANKLYLDNLPKKMRETNQKYICYTEEEKGSMEKEVLGHYITCNPYIDLPCFSDPRLSQLNDIGEYAIGSNVTIAAVISKWKKRTAKTGNHNPYVTCDILSPFSSMPGLIFAKTLFQYDDDFWKTVSRETQVVISAKVSTENEEDFFNSTKLMINGVELYQALSTRVYSVEVPKEKFDEAYTLLESETEVEGEKVILKTDQKSANFGIILFRHVADKLKKMGATINVEKIWGQ